MSERIRRKMVVRRMVGNGTSTRMGVWVWRLGEGYLVGHPNELYSDLQRQLRSRFPNRAIAAMNLVNGGIGYLPPAHLYDLDLYQVWQSPFGRGSLERVIEAAGAAIEKLGAP